MPAPSRRAKIELLASDKKMLEEFAKSYTEPVGKVQKAQILLDSVQGVSVTDIARKHCTSRPRVERTIDKALEFGINTALQDLPRPGRPNIIPDDAKLWIVSLACQKPKDLGYSYEVWTHNLLAEHVRKNCLAVNFEMLERIGKGTICKILSSYDIKPHKIKYYLEKRDPDFEEKMQEVLYTYEEASLIKEFDVDGAENITIVSYDEKPGIQAIENTAPDLLPVPGKYSTIARDHEYIRHGTVSLLAGIDLLTGHVHGRVEDRHCSKEFVEFLEDVNRFYEAKDKIKIILDNHTIHTSAETRRYLSSVPNRFEFVFTPKHGSWLNMIECFFSKMTRTVLRYIRVGSIDELKERLRKYIAELNENPVVFNWKYEMAEMP